MGYIVDTLKCYLQIAGVRGVMTYVGSKFFKNSITQKMLCIDTGDVAAPIWLRVPSSDVITYWQVFVAREYAVDTSREPAVIIDAGANIGLASIYFANRFPHSAIIAIEPEDSNFKVLCKNVAPYKNITTIHAALWNENKDISLVDPGLGNSGFMTQDGRDDATKSRDALQLTRGMTIDRIMEECCIEHIDILKIDIEGAEREVFNDSSRWIDKVDSMIVELHERMKPGCNLSFSKTVSKFDRRWSRGENIIVSKLNGCLKSH